MKYTQLYTPQLQFINLKELPSVYEIVEVYCGFAIYVCQGVYYAFRMKGVWVDIANNFVLGYTRSNIDALRDFIDTLSAFQEINLKIHLLTASRNVKVLAKHLDGCKLYNINTNKEYFIMAPVVKKHIAEQTGLLVSELNRIIQGDIVAGWLLVK